MRTLVTVVLGLLACSTIGCAGNGDASAKGPVNPPISRSLLAPAAIPPAEAARNADAAARFTAKNVSLTHTPSSVIAAEVYARAIISPDETTLFTVSRNQIKRWSLPDGKLLNAINIDPHPYCQAAMFPNGFRSGVLTDKTDGNVVLVDGGKTLLYRVGEFANYRYDLATSVVSREPVPYVLPADPFMTSDVYVRVTTREEETMAMGVRYTMESRSVTTRETFAQRHVNTDDELETWPKDLYWLPRATVAGYDPAHNVAYLCRVNKDLDWVIDAMDLSPVHQTNGWDGPRSTLARSGQTLGRAVAGTYSSCNAMVSSDFRYAVMVQLDSTWTPGYRCVVVDLTAGRELGTVGPAEMHNTVATSFANGLLTLQTNIGKQSDGKVRVLTYQVPSLKLLESLEVNQAEGAVSDSTTIAAVSPTHRYIVINSDLPGGVASMTVYDLQNGTVKQLDDDEPTRAFVAKSNAAIKDAYARLPDVVAKELARIKKVDDERAQLSREFTEMVRPPVYSSPPAPTLNRRGNTGGNQSVTCSQCNGEGIVLTHAYIGGYQTERKTDHGSETVRVYDESRWGTKPCPTCGGSGRIN